MRPHKQIVTIILLALLAAGCTAKPAPDTGKVNPDGQVVIASSGPLGDMLPANSTDQTSTTVIEGLYAGLVGYGPDGATHNRMAEAFTTTDAKTFHVKLKQGWKFHDGTEVKARNFVDAWNYGAYGPNAQIASGYFEQIAGYDQVHPADPDGEDGPQKAPEPTARTLSGLKVINDYEFDITLKAPFSVFTAKVGYNPFMPLPDRFFADPKAYTKNPIGNGPLKYVSHTPKADIKLTRFDGYLGDNKMKFKELTIRTGSDPDTNYRDVLAGNLDFIGAIPPSAKAGDKYKAELGNQTIPVKSFGLNSLIVPAYLPEYTVDVRRAISMAINREQVLKAMNSTSKPADGWVPPGLEGYEPDVCGEYCEYNPEKAKQLLAKAGFRGKITFTSYGTSVIKTQAEATCDSIRGALGVECEVVPAGTFEEYRKVVSSHKLAGLGVTNWFADYPSIENVLNPTEKTGGAGNEGLCSNKELDVLLERADATADKAEAVKLYQQAHRAVANSFCRIPFSFSSGGLAARSKNLKSAAGNFSGFLDLASVEVLAR